MYDNQRLGESWTVAQYRLEKEGTKMKHMRIGILTCGGDCPGLNAVLRGVTKAAESSVGR